MKRIIDIKELKQGDQIVRFDGEKTDYFEFLMIHPNNEHYVLLIESCSQNAIKYYIPNILDNDNWQMDYKFKDILNRECEYYKKCIEQLEERVEKL